MFILVFVIHDAPFGSQLYETLVGVGLTSGEGSTHISPNHSLSVHVVVALSLVLVFVVEVVVVLVVVGSLHPHQPLLLQVVVVVVVTDVLVVVVGMVVTVGAGAGAEVRYVVVYVVVASSLQPNQPGVRQVVVVTVLVSVTVLLVLSSRHPHHPGVLQVSVRVLLLVVEVLVGAKVVVDSVPLLSKNFQLKQSTQSSTTSQVGTSSYTLMTSRTTTEIRCVVIPLRQPRSLTVSYLQ